MAYEILDYCPKNLSLTKRIDTGHWSSAPAELFSRSEGSPPNHIHFQMSRADAYTIWHNIKHLVPDSIETVSFRKHAFV